MPLCLAHRSDTSEQLLAEWKRLMKRDLVKESRADVNPPRAA